MTKTYVMLGALGDICNVLPLWWEEARISGPVDVAVSAKYASLLDGVSYVKPRVYQGDYANTHGAIRDLHIPKMWARVCQCHGHINPAQRGCEDFCREQWRFYGERQLDWGTIPLVFDRRNREREKHHLRNWPTDKPWVLVAPEGRSSPFSHKSELLKFLEQQLPNYWIVDLSGYLFDKPYDMLTAFEHAHCLVTVDTFHLHLAHAVPNLPVICLHNDHPWLATPRRAQHVLRVPYSRWDRQKVNVVEAIKSIPTRRTSLIWHVYSDYPRQNGALHRHEIAKASWKREADANPGVWHSVPINNSMLTRTSKKVHDRDRELPFIHDLLAKASARANNRDWIVLSNDDIGFVAGFTGTLLNSPLDCCWSNRVDIAHIVRPPQLWELQGAIPYCGTDTFCMRKRWWRENQTKMPDMLLGCEAWDLCMRVLMKESGGTEVVWATYHEQHPSFWNRNENRRNAGNLHNIQLAVAFLKRRKMSLNDFR